MDQGSLLAKNLCQHTHSIWRESFSSGKECPHVFMLFRGRDCQMIKEQDAIDLLPYEPNPDERHEQVRSAIFGLAEREGSEMMLDTGLSSECANLTSFSAKVPKGLCILTCITCMDNHQMFFYVSPIEDGKLGEEICFIGCMMTDENDSLN